MKRATTLVAACAIVFSAPSLGQPTPNCNAGCTVFVSVPASCGSGIQVSLDPIFIQVDSRRKALIKWVIAKESSWSFASSGGINFLNHDPAAFDNARPAGAGKQVTVTNTPSRAGVYKYDINLARVVEVDDGKGGKRRVEETCKLDPTVINW